MVRTVPDLCRLLSPRLRKTARELALRQAQRQAAAEYAAAVRRIIGQARTER